MVSADGAKWTKDNLGTQSVDKAPFSGADPDIQLGRGEGRSSIPPGLKKKKSALRASVWSKNKGGGATWVPPLDPQLILYPCPGTRALALSVKGPLVDY